MPGQERVGDEVAQYIAWAGLHEEPDSVVVPEGLDVIHPMDGRFQMGHQIRLTSPGSDGYGAMVVLEMTGICGA